MKNLTNKFYFLLFFWKGINYPLDVRGSAWRFAELFTYWMRHGGRARANGCLKARTLGLAAPPPAASPKPSRTRMALAGSERPSERQRRPCPSKADWSRQDTGAPQGAVPIDLSSYNREWY